ncbi:putative receptor-like protein kinase [Acorus gramineus]|uniref:Receptor-like protein kinase n=1 Tax=Acorus gramineus TaxID=55184 RepID=A0AAV9BYL7_ACOGR|nr:putative receptor-like protein kinase [Acorus gramineus]
MRSIGGVSHKSDAYIYGMLLLDMVVQKENVEFENDRSSILHFPNWIYIQLDRWREMELDGSVIEEVELHVARKMVLVGLWCVHINPFDGPSISRVLEMLEGSHENIEIPPPPPKAFLSFIP